MKVVRIISDGWHTYIEIDGKMYGENIKSVVFTHDTSGEHCDGYEHSVLQMKDDNGTVFDSRFDKYLSEDYVVDTFHTFDGVSKIVIDAANKGAIEDELWLTNEIAKREAEREKYMPTEEEIQEMRRLLGVDD